MICDYCKREHIISFILKILGQYAYEVCLECYNSEMAKRIAYRAVPKAVT